MKFYLCLLLLVPLAMIVCAPPAEEELRKAADELAKEWDAAMEAGDYDAIAALFTEDGMKMDSDAPTAVGREAIRSAVQADTEARTYLQSKSVAEEIRFADDWAVVSGTYQETTVPKTGGEQVQITGKWMEIHEKQADGSWKIARSIWNRDAPLPTPE